MSQFPSRLLFLLVRDWEQAKALLYIRNECCEGMTHHTDIITLDQQKIFFDKHLHPEYGDGKYLAYLLIDHNNPIGYGGLSEEGDRYWMTIGVALNERGKGYSDKLIKLITHMGHKRGKEVWLDCWDDNPAINGYHRNGYELIDIRTINGRNQLVMKYKG